MANTIHSTARIHPGVILGDNNVIHENVIIGGFKDQDCDIVIGDGNVFHADMRILVLSLRMGNDSMFHNHVSILAGHVEIGNDCWVGQHSELDGTGGLLLEDNVNIGSNCYIWSHAGSSKLLPDCLLVNTKKTILRRGVWVIGCNCIVSPGVEMAEKSILLPNAALTKGTSKGKVYGGVPARELSIKGWED